MLATSQKFLCWLLFLGSCVLVLGTFRGNTNIKTLFELINSKVVLEKVIEELTLENKELEKEVKKITTSPMYAKKILRDKYHILEQGEELVFFEKNPKL